ncbi:hypothetical protein [Phytohabitans houttuyneae]|uniref:Uncharacterized protein n=1 Tax=Phytohabitans houttuyneae TaxID=1076126 RepID=A0A6V8KBL2_9ACTN|nr:hypothetical protein [Phytohabitans houttuyneae]GFJ79539.1 hypothetical protein Phou_037190 [Phytohabitans houttuyneae]
MAEQIEVWPFGRDADRDHPLTAHRIAVTSSHPGWRFLVAFDRESEAQPTDAEAAMLASFLSEYKDRHYGDSGYRRRMEQRTLDVDNGANGLVFHKWGDDDWGFRRQSFERGFLFTVVWPVMRNDDRYAGHEWRGPLALHVLMDRIHTVCDDKPMQRWTDWKAAHPEVFAVAGEPR